MPPTADSGLTRRRFLRHGAVAAASPLFAAQRSSRRPNVLFLAVDDLRPDLGCYGNNFIKTPHIDRLASRGLTFQRAYCQQAVCSPSRTSLLTGLRPDTTRVYDLMTHFRRYLPDAVTLPQHFKNHGYQTTAFGKIFHKPQMDDWPSWSIPSWIPSHYAWDSPANAAFTIRKWRELKRNDWRSDETFYHDPGKRGPRPKGQRGWGMPSWEARDVHDHEMPDGETAEAASAALKSLASGGRPFFLAAGFLKPHLPFRAPQRYFDLYRPQKIELARQPEPPLDVPPYALHNSAELRGYSDIPESGPIPEDKARELIRAYYAAVSYADAQVGKLLGALDELGLTENTVVVLWGDHGYHLGDHGLWNKHTNFEAATRSPLIVSAPGQKNAGRKIFALTEFVDIYPSLCDLCGLPIPQGLEGSSFLPLFENPDRLWKRAVFSQYPREIPGVGPGMGYSMRTRRYRYTEWTPETGGPYKAAELYDYETDPYESHNLANRPEHVSLVNGLSGMLQEGWRSSLPPAEGPV